MSVYSGNDSALDFEGSEINVIPLTAATQMSSKTGKTDQVQSEVDQVVGIMHGTPSDPGNINKVMQRGEHLESLQNKTEDLQNSSLQFKRGANQVRREVWWKDMKLKLIIGGIVSVVLIIIIGTPR